MIYYTVAIRIRKTSRDRVSIWALRDTKQFAIGSSTGETLEMLSSKPRNFWDSEDEVTLLSACRNFLKQGETGEKHIGSFEVSLLYSKAERAILVHCCGTQIATWNPDKGLRFLEDAHSIFHHDKDYLASECNKLNLSILKDQLRVRKAVKI